MIFSTATLFALVNASPVKLHSRDSGCPTLLSGFLAANVSNGAIAFTWNTHSQPQLTYVGDGRDEVNVEFQHCDDPTFPTLEFGYYGNIYVPSWPGECIAISNQESKVEPYYATRAPCVHGSSGQMFFTNDLTSFVWTGATNEECRVLYYKSTLTGEPELITSDDGTTRVQLVCSTSGMNVPTETETERPFLITKWVSQ